MLHIGNSIKEVNTLGNINTNSIFTELIQAAGMGCEKYASDIIYDINAINQAIEANEEKVFYLGIRTMGVDGTTFMRSRLNNGACSDYYLKIYRISISIDGEYMTVICERISIYDAEKALKED